MHTYMQMCVYGGSSYDLAEISGKELWLQIMD